MNEDDRFSLEALRHIHKQLDDDNDGGIEVNESVEVRRPCYACSANTHQFSSVTQLTFWPGFLSLLTTHGFVAISALLIDSPAFIIYYDHLFF